MQLIRTLLRPIGYLLFVVALAALSGAARVLGEKEELGFFSGRLSAMLWRYPEVTRSGVQMAWLAWAALFVLAASPADPIRSEWDEIGLAALALVVIGHRLFSGNRARAERPDR